MDFSNYSDLTVRMAVDLANTLNAFSGEDELETLDDLTRFLDQYERDWHAEDWHAAQPTEEDVKRVRQLRTTLRRVFDAEDDAAAAEILNGVLAKVKAIPRISVHSASPHLHFEPVKSTTTDWLAAATAMGLGVVLCDYGLARFGKCSAHDCLDVYIDTSKNRSRRNCSTGCTNRENVAAHRARARTSSGRQSLRDEG